RTPARRAASSRSTTSPGAGDEVDLRAFSWASPLVTAAFEMDRVRPCDPESPAALCSLPPRADGAARLALQVPPGSADLRYHPDVVELRDHDYPATWSGEFVAPGGARTPFQTAARTRQDLDPPGLVAGPVPPGEWLVEFTLTLNGTRAPGAVAGFITYRTPGFGPFDSDLLREPDAGRQTRRALDAAQERVARLRVAALAPADGTLARLGVAALLAPEDARGLYGVEAANATALVVPYAEGAEARLAEAAAPQETPALRALRLRPLVERPPTRHDDALAWAPAHEAHLLSGRLPPGGDARLNGTALAPGVRLLAMPAGERPWDLVPGAHWPTAEEAVRTIASSAHLVLVSEDLAREAGLDPGRATYARLEVESALGPRTVFVMGAVSGGPPRTVWATAALVVALAAPAGGRALEGGAPLV
ncbi:MAG TPA: hypothetical protein VNX21_00020, partial [Candidatus Thermoplasmatota archaeon]|nr:hypothetical protein [Candidatus Thermoplasmatota archaeon]